MTANEPDSRATGDEPKPSATGDDPTAWAARDVAAGGLPPVASEPTVLVVDNYDSFAYNLVQYVGELAGDVVVHRNDAITVAGIRDLDPDAIVVSPGPGTPAEAGVSISVFEELSIPTLGVCLGHQALCAAHGTPVVHAPEVVHGKPSTIAHDGDGVFEDLPARLRVGRYHSLAVDRDDLPAELEETASTTSSARDDRERDDHERDRESEHCEREREVRDAREESGREREVVMAVRHHSKPHVGVQFHPESILTGDGSEPQVDGEQPDLSVGKRLVRNFLCNTT